MKRQIGLLTLTLLLVGVLAACGTAKKKTVIKKVTPNQAPVVSILAPVKVAPGVTVVLDASASQDPEGGALTFLWEESTQNPANNFLNGVDVSLATLTFAPDVTGTFTYTVTVKDAQRLAASATVSILVEEGVTPPSQYAPTVTGVIITAAGVQNFVSLAGTQSAAVFTDATGPLTLTVLGTDPDTALAKLTATFTNGSATGGRNGTVTLPDMTKDADGFANLSVGVKLKDDLNNLSPVKTIPVRIVPHATSTLKAKAIYVDANDLGVSPDGTPANPYKTIQAGYDAAKVLPSGSQDVYIAAGTYAESVTVDFSNVSLYGRFAHSASDWRRRIDTVDKALDLVAPALSRYASLNRTTLINPGAPSLVGTPVSGTVYAGAVTIDGLSFALSNNSYGVYLVSRASDDVFTLKLRQNEFSGTVTNATGTYIGGAVVVNTGTPAAYNGTDIPIEISRNFFAVDTQDGKAKFQVWILPKSITVVRTALVSNVFYGTLGDSGGSGGTNCTSRVCAFSLPKTGKETAGSAVSYYHLALRNLFWVRAVHASGSFSTPAVLVADNPSDTSVLAAYGNVFFLDPNAGPTVLLKGSGNRGVFQSNFFPAPRSGLVYYTYGLSNYDCTAITPPGTFTSCGAGSAPCNGGNFTCNSQSTYAGSFTTSATPAWRFTNTAFKDSVPTTINTLTPSGPFDFDETNGYLSATSSLYDAGPFERN